METKTVLALSHQLTAQTGFAKITRNVMIDLAKQGHEVYAIGQSYHGFPIHPKELEGVTMLPIGQDNWGADIAQYYFEQYRPDIMWTLTDIWACHYLHTLPKPYPWHWLRHITLDTENITPWWAETIRNTDVPIAFSNMGRKLLDSIDVTWGAYIQHGIDTKTFHPATNDEKLKLRADREWMEVLQANQFSPKGKGVLAPDDFVVLCIAHNQFRKNLDVLLRAFAKFAIDKTNVKLIMHCQPRDGHGWDIPQLLRKYNLFGKVFLTSMNSKMVADVFVSDKMMRDLYVSADVHALLSGGEGFGIPIVEAMACGIPNVATMWTTPKEFLADETDTEVEKDGQKMIERRFDFTRGLLVPVDHVVDHHTGGEWGIANEAAAAQALQLLYDNPDIREKMGKNAREFAVKNYDWKRVLPKWRDVVANPEKYEKPFKTQDPTLRLLDWRA